MHRIDGPGHDNNQFTEGDPQIPTPATTVTADILNALQEEIASVIEGSGDTLDKADNGQLLQAIDALRNAAYSGFDRVTRRHDSYGGHLDTILHNSVYDIGDDGSKGTPLGSGWYFVETRVHSNTDEYSFQMAYGFSGVAARRVWFRRRGSGVWGGWVEVSSAPVEAGSITQFAGSTPPSGYFECNGAAVSRTTYAGLFAVIGTIWGVGNGSSTFNLPDLRGEFIRGWDNGRGTDVGRAFASAQAESANVSVPTQMSSATSQWGNNVVLPDAGWSSYNQTGRSDGGGQGLRFFMVDKGDETRPRNISMMYCIKY